MKAPDLQTVDRQTFFSRLDFRTKFLVFAVVSFVAALWDNPWLGGALMLAVLAACLAVGVSRSYLGFMFRVMTPFFLILLVTHGLFNIEYVLRLTGHAHLRPVLGFPRSWPVLGGRSFSREGLLYGANVIFKSMTFLLVIPLCVFTTEPNNLIVGLVRLHVPYKLAFVVSSTMRFFPLVFDEIQSVMEAQRLRGYAVDELGAYDKVRTYAKVSIPVILGALFKAQQIEVVLHSKAFSGSSDRTYLEDSSLRRADAAVMAATAAGLAAVLWLYFHAGVGRFLA